MSSCKNIWGTYLQRRSGERWMLSCSSIRASTNPASSPIGVDKWEALRALGVARKRYGLSDRELSVLQALISFHPGRTLDPRGGPLVVYPSNRTICERLNGMPCSTMRRHLARLVAVGLIIRRDSPNGKRYSRRYAGEKIAFGFDLTPLAARFQEFSDAARRRAAGRRTSQASTRNREPHAPRPWRTHRIRNGNHFRPLRLAIPCRSRHGGCSIPPPEARCKRSVRSRSSLETGPARSRRTPPILPPEHQAHSF